MGKFRAKPAAACMGPAGLAGPCRSPTLAGRWGDGAAHEQRYSLSSTGKSGPNSCIRRGKKRAFEQQYSLSSTGKSGLNFCIRRGKKRAFSCLVALSGNRDSTGQARGVAQCSYLPEPTHARLAARWEQQSPKPWGGLTEVPPWRNHGETPVPKHIPKT